VSSLRVQFETIPLSVTTSGINEKDERCELLDAVADAGRSARGLDQLFESLAHVDQLDPLDVERILALR